MIINKLAEYINNTISNLYDQGIHFYVIIIILFIKNFIIYVICRMIKIAKNPSYKSLLRR